MDSSSAVASTTIASASAVASTVAAAASPPVAAAAPGAVHTASSLGFSHAANALYDAGRPAYADEVVDWMLRRSVLDELVQDLSSSASSSSTTTAPPTPAPRVIRLVELGCGTGIFTRCLAARVRAFESAHSSALSSRGISFEVLGVDPSEGMRQRFREACPADMQVLEGSGACMPALATSSVDVIFSAQAFHWFADQASLTELSRVLRADRPSFFVPVWNSRDTSVGWVGALEDQIVDPRYGVDVPRQKSKAWQAVFSLEPKRFVLKEDKEWKDGMVQTGGEKMVLDRILSISVIASLPEAERDAVARDIRNLLANHQDTKDSKEYQLPYVTDAYIYRRLPTADASSSSSAAVSAASHSSSAAASAASSSSLPPLIPFNDPRLTWLNAPASSVVNAEGSELEVVTGLRGDFWRETYYGFTRDSGHLLGMAWPSSSGEGAGSEQEGFTAQVRVRADFTSLYDQAGLMVRVGPNQWCKAGLELSDGVAMLSSVVTNPSASSATASAGGLSDWATSRFTGDASDFLLRITLEKGALRIQASSDQGKSWPLVRLAPFVLPSATPILVGPMCCTPEREGLRVKFSELRIGKPLGKDLHDLS